jgi:putative transposase
MLSREGFHMNHKKVYRLYKEENLLIRTRKRRKMASQARAAPPACTRLNERWSLDFMSDQLSNGARFRLLTVIDIFSRECLALRASYSFTAEDVSKVLDEIIAARTQPKLLTLDNGTEFTSRHFDAWAYHRGVRLDFIRPGCPYENGHIESFNGRVRDECLSQNWFANIAEARRIAESWREEYNETRPHSSLGNLPPKEYAARMLRTYEERLKQNREKLSQLWT